jgi:hypothetical protein
VSEAVAPVRSGPARYADRRVVMFASATLEPSLSDVVTNLATVCAETGQTVALLSTAGLASPGGDSELAQPAPLWWKHWPSGGNGDGIPMEEERIRLVTGPLSPSDVKPLLGETGVPGVSRLDLQYFVGHPAQVVIRVPEVLAALRQLVDVVFLEVPSYLTIHHGEGLTPLADVVVVVGERETTTVAETHRISRVLRRLDAPVVGMVLTDGGVEIYNWGRVDSSLEAGREEPTEVGNDPTQELPVSKSDHAAPGSPTEAWSVVEHAPREA